MVNLNDISEIEFTDKKIIENHYNEEEIDNLEKRIVLEEFNPFIWYPVVPFNKIPEVRGGHTMNLIGDYLIVFGGCNVNFKCFDDLFFFNFM